MSGVVLFQTIQFKLQKLFHFKQFSLGSVRSLIVQTVLIQKIQFSISTQFSSIWSLDTTLSGTTTPGQSGPRSDGNKGYSAFPKVPLEPHHWIV